MYRRFSSSFNGKICEISGLYADNFENPFTDGAKAYFLSHFHTDHTVGLNSEQLQIKLETEKNVFIYATKMTACIIVHKYPYLEEYVKILDIGSNLISIPGDETNPELILNVTLIPAGHCLGSTMFLFQTKTTKVLYTGDFRIRPNDLPKYSAFHDKNGDVIKLDTVYVDTTFLHSHECFPKRSDSVDEVLELIRSYLDSHEDQLVVLDISATYGYEYVFNKIYEVLGIKVYVEEDKWAFYRKIPNLVKGVTNDPNETRVFLKPMRNGGIPRPSIVQEKYIRFSAYRWNGWDEDMASVEENKCITYVCFSTHCSKVEVVSFVNYLNPNKVEGFPKPYCVQDSPNLKGEGDFVLTPRKSPKIISSPLTLKRKDKKVSEDVLRQLFK